MGDARFPAEAFPVGTFIREELDARGWTVRDLAREMGWPRPRVAEVISGSMPVQWRIATDLGTAFGTSMSFWLNTEATYRCHCERMASDD